MMSYKSSFFLGAIISQLHAMAFAGGPVHKKFQRRNVSGGGTILKVYLYMLWKPKEMQGFVSSDEYWKD